MRVFRQLLIATLVCAMLSALPPARPAQSATLTSTACAPNTGTGGIAGSVTGPGGTPVQNVSVTAYTEYGIRAGSASTNASGAYQVTGLINGNYLLLFETRFVNTDLMSAWYDGPLDPNAATPVSVMGGALTSGISIELTPGTQFSGTVEAADGGPLQSVPIELYDATGAVVARATTNASGEYRTTPGVPSGDYRLRFDDPIGQAYLGEFFNASDSLETATVVTAVAPISQSAINATLARGATISGQVIDATTGNPLPNMSVNVFGEGGSAFSFTDVEGRYTTSAGLRGGEYTVEVSATFDSQNFIPTQRTISVANAANRTDIDIAVETGGILTGIVRDSEGTPVQSANILVIGTTSEIQEFGNTAADGTFAVNGLPSDTYAILVRRNGFINQYYDGQLDFSAADRVSVTAPETTPPVEITLQRGSAISGIVTDAVTNAPIEGVFVEALDASGGRVESGFTNAAGEYNLSATLPSGAYFIRFNPDDRNASCAYGLEYYDDQPDLEGATPVTVTAPDPVTGINAALSPGSLIFGRVTDAADNTPLQGISIRVRDAAGNQVATGRTTFLGGYLTNPALPSGTYTIEFTDFDQVGYIDQFYAGARTIEAATPITLSAPTDRTGIDAALALGGQISGRVTGIDDGAGLPNVTVRVFNAAGQEVATTTSSFDGSYTISQGLPSGDYRIGFDPRRTHQGELTLAQGGDESEQPPAGYLPTFYRNARTLAEAEVVRVTAPATTAAIDIALPRGVLLPLVAR